MHSSYVPPAYQAKKFNCPHCDALAAMEWHFLCPLNVDIIGTGYQSYWAAAVCAACGEQSLWLTKSKKPFAKAVAAGLQMCYPAARIGSPASGDMPEAIRQDYTEARAIATLSPRAAAALLRLCVQKLCIHFGEKGEKIDSDIKSLVAKGLNPLAQRALDTIRIVGNNAVHPGKLSDEEMTSAVPVLFQVISFIIDDLITKPRLVNEAYGATPQSARDAIEKRDGKA